jgi:phage shock protein A
MLIFGKEIEIKWVLVGSAILAGTLLFVILSIPSCQKPPDTTASIAAVKVELEKQYTAQLKEKETQIADYKTRLTQSEYRYAGMVQKYVELEKRKQNVTAPTTNKELRDRFSALGYPPLAVK